MPAFGPGAGPALLKITLVGMFIFVMDDVVRAKLVFKIVEVRINTKNVI
jgi:hypothetical protein